MKNNYRIENEVAVVEVISKGQLHEVLIDIDDLERLQQMKRTIFKLGNYFGIRLGKKQVLLHRFLMGFHEPDRTIVVDHENGNKNDNRKSNLRVLTQKENCRNLNNNLSKKNKTGVRNVSFNKKLNTFDVTFSVNGKTKRYGCFKTIEEAEQRANEVREVLWR